MIKRELREPVAKFDIIPEILWEKGDIRVDEEIDEKGICICRWRQKDTKRPSKTYNYTERYGKKMENPGSKREI